VALGRVVPPLAPTHRGQQRARGGESMERRRFSVYKAKKTLSLDPILVAYYDSDLNKVL
jgi:hypothetical protein